MVEPLVSDIETRPLKRLDLLRGEFGLWLRLEIRIGGIMTQARAVTPLAVENDLIRGIRDLLRQLAATRELTEALTARHAIATRIDGSRHENIREGERENYEEDSYQAQAPSGDANDTSQALADDAFPW